MPDVPATVAETTAFVAKYMFSATAHATPAVCIVHTSSGPGFRAKTRLAPQTCVVTLQLKRTWVQQLAELLAAKSATDTLHNSRAHVALGDDWQA
jgi:3-keto-L-gulonate-6-phosphate decarboxylase